MRRTTLYTVSLLGLVLAIGMTSAEATPKVVSQARALAKDYAAQHDFPVRKVQVTTRSGQRVWRLFVPVTEASLPSFVDAFSQKNGVATAYVRESGHNEDTPPTNNIYVRFALTPEKIYASAADVGPVAQSASNMTLLDPSYRRGRYLALALGKRRLGYYEKFLDERHRGNYGAEHPDFARERNLSEVTTGNCRANCMWWFVHGETALNQGLAEPLGVRRSRAPENLVRKFAYQGNERVPVIGIKVDSIDHFMAMSNERLLGEAPLAEQN